ncbi:hypothetical protein BDZ45DRAFT_669804 [Acephala macrosclerotiorum]|nr:hypothetical protein BDZ45DRAFT_669804 [Acephala macrosclerotiorum]
MRLLTTFILCFYIAAVLALPIQKTQSESPQHEPSTISVLQRSISFESRPPVPTNRVTKKFRSMPGTGAQLQAKSKAAINVLSSSISVEASTSPQAPANTLIKRYKPTPPPVSTNRVIKRFKTMPAKGRRMEIQKRGMAGGAIAGVVLGVLALVCMCVAVGWILLG